MDYIEFEFELNKIGLLFGRNFKKEHFQMIYEEAIGDMLPDDCMDGLKQYLLEKDVNSLKPIDVVRGLKALGYINYRDTKDKFWCEFCGNTGWVSLRYKNEKYACICSCDCNKATRLRENPNFDDILRFKDLKEEHLKKIVFEFPTNPNETVAEDLIEKIKKLKSILAGDKKIGM